MTTASTNTTVSMASSATFQAWVAEIVTMLFTTLGVTQTTDTGQINPATVSVPGTANTSAGYVIGRFNDTAQATSPIFFKLEFGTNGTATNPAMWITIGTGSNGAGTLTGVVGTRVILSQNTAIASPGVTPYITRACYNTTNGVLWLAWKLNGTGTTNQCIAGFAITRSNDSNGNVTTDAVGLYVNSATTTPVSQAASAQFISYLTNTAYNGTNGTNVQAWCAFPFHATVTLFSTNAQIGPVWQYTPVLGINNWLAVALVGEFAVGTTVSIANVGATAHTYIAAGCPFNTSNFGEQVLSCIGGAANTYTMVMVWE